MDTPPRVAFFVETDGLHRLMSNALPKMAAAGIDAQLVSLRPPGPLHAALENNGVSTFSLQCQGAKNYPLAAVDLGRLLRRNHIDILQSCEPIQAAIGGFARLLAPEVIHVFQRQHMWISLPVQRWFSDVGTRLSHFTLANSHATAKWIEDVEGVPSTKVHVAHYGVPPHRLVGGQEVVALRSDLGIPKDAQVILLAGHLRPEKGQRVLVEALPAIRAGAPGSVHAVFVGTGPDESVLRNLCGGDRTVHLVGYQEDIAPWFALADVVAVPSLYDSFPQAAVEVFATGRPLVASAVGGLKEIVDRDSGILVPPGDALELAKVILEVLRSPERAGALARAGRQRFERYFTIDEMVERWVAFYRHLLQADRLRETHRSL